MEDSSIQFGVGVEFGGGAEICVDLAATGFKSEVKCIRRYCFWRDVIWLMA